jgi:hypothetical protein
MREPATTLYASMAAFMRLTVLAVSLATLAQDTTERRNRADVYEADEHAPQHLGWRLSSLARLSLA